MFDQGVFYIVYDDFYNSGWVIFVSWLVVVVQFNINGGCILQGLGDFNMLWFWLVEYKICEVCFKSLDWFNDLIGDVFFSQYSVNIVVNVDEVDDILLDGGFFFLVVWLGYFGDFNKVYCWISLELGEYVFNSLEFF